MIEKETNRATIDRLIADVGEAKRTLEASRRDTCAEHNERIRKLRDIEVSLYSSRASSETEMFDVTALVSPELSRIIQDPTHDL